MPFLIALVSLLVAGTASAGEQVIGPMPGDRFGEAMVAELEFVEKPGTYHSRNIIKTKWMARVISVN